MEDHRLKVFMEEKVDLKGKKRLVVDKVGDGSIIKLFDKTPLPLRPTDVVCPHFLELKWADGCYFNCSWCYLNGTFRFHPEWKNGKPNIKSFSQIKSHLEALLLSDGSGSRILNSGELSDSLLAEKEREGTPPFSGFIVNVLKSCDVKNRYRVLFLTKSTEIDNLLALAEDATSRIIVSFTLNADAVSQRWEKGAPSVRARIRAAKKVSEAGYETRIRIDPIVPIEHWEKHYSGLVDEVFSSFKPERLTLGSLRGLNSTIRNSKDQSWTAYLSEKSNWGRKVEFKTRYKTYHFITEKLRKEYRYKHIAFCKETVQMWRELGFDYKRIACNCTN
jgi:spore photoproduct lyase